MRMASFSIRSMACETSSSPVIAPMRYSSAYPRTVTSGVRSSWLASPMNRRICRTVASRWLIAASTLPSIALMAVFRRPTSVVVGSMSVMRRLKSPAAINMAVDSTWPRLRKVRVTSHRVRSAPMTIEMNAKIP